MIDLTSCVLHLASCVLGRFPHHTITKLHAMLDVLAALAIRHASLAHPPIVRMAESEPLFIPANADFAYLDDRDHLVGTLGSAELLSRDEAAGFWPVDLDVDPAATQMAYVDETECIGCTYCKSIARATFAMEDESGKARAVQQGEASDEIIEEAMDACPANCIHWATRTELEWLETRREQGSHEHLDRWNDPLQVQVRSSARIRAEAAKPKFPGEAYQEQRRNQILHMRRDGATAGATDEATAAVAWRDDGRPEA